MKVIVQKFGGTSVATDEARERAIERIIKAKKEGYAPVVVVSAMGRKGAPYATDTLISLLRAVDEEIEPRELDLLVSCGEIISTTLMAHSLKAKGYPAVAFTGGQAGIKTDSYFGNAQILEIQPTEIIKHLADDKIVVVAGFQGMDQNGAVTTLGRGGSDTTATALGAALKAEVVEIYTDVDGVMTVDPRLVPEAQILNDVTYREICEMAHQGAKVIHPKAVEIAMGQEIPIRVKNTFSEADGTLIATGAAERVITGLAHLTDLAQIGVSLSDNNGQGTKVKAFKLLAEANISIDFISVMPEVVYFAVQQDQAIKALQVLKNEGLEAKLNTECAKLSVVGAGMQGVVGVMAEIMEKLHQEGITVLQTSDSDITISFLIKQEDLAKATQLLHESIIAKKN